MKEEKRRKDAAELVRQVKRRDENAPEAFARLYETVYKDLYRTALYTLGSIEDAENVVGDAVLDAYAGIEKLRDEEAFRAWIFAILSNKLKNQLAEYAKTREHTAPSPVEEYAETLGTEETELARLSERDALRRAFAVLSEEERSIVTLRIYGELDSGEIAVRLRLNRGTVRSKYSRALAKLREALRGGDEENRQQAKIDG